VGMFQISSVDAPHKQQPWKNKQTTGGDADDDNTLNKYFN